MQLLPIYKKIDDSPTSKLLYCAFLVL